MKTYKQHIDEVTSSGYSAAHEISSSLDALGNAIDDLRQSFSDGIESSMEDNMSNLNKLRPVYKKMNAHILQLDREWQNLAKLYNSIKKIL